MDNCTKCGRPVYTESDEAEGIRQGMPVGWGSGKCRRKYEGECPADSDAERIAALEAECERLTRKVNRCREAWPRYDCQQTGGDYADVSGSHCPPGDPCYRCRAERAEEALEALEAAQRESVETLKWENKGLKEELARLKKLGGGCDHW